MPSSTRASAARWSRRWASSLTLPTAGGKLLFTHTDAFAKLAGKDVATLPVTAPTAQSSNTVVTLGERLFLKGYRRLRPGINPELEMGRFLTEVAKYPNCVPVAGALEYVAADGSTMTLAMVQAFVPNQGDGWDYTLSYLERSSRGACAPSMRRNPPMSTAASCR
jgi:maltose alpha-D-glucosyltransferase/alpha-amylase